MKKQVLGPSIRYHSVLMPNVAAKDAEESELIEEISKLEDGQENESAPPLPPLPKNVAAEDSSDLFERTFISFSNDDLFKKVFEKVKGTAKPPEKRICALTQ